jgi:hypothetical protein
MKPAAAIDFAHGLMHRLGWSVGEALFLKKLSECMVYARPAPPEKRLRESRL